VSAFDRYPSDEPKFGTPNGYGTAWPDKLAPTN
jgi:hypothetical protein